MDADDAMKTDAPQAHNPQPNVQPAETRGDQAAVAAQFARCAATGEGEFRTQFEHHVCLETHGVVVDYRGGDTATIYASTQGTFSVPGDAAQELGLAESSVHCVVQHMGGGFGSKFGLDLPGSLACQLAKKTKRPVQFELVEPALKTLLAWLERRGGTLNDFVFPSRNDYMEHMSTRQYARLVREWVTGIGL